MHLDSAYFLWCLQRSVDRSRWTGRKMSKWWFAATLPAGLVIMSLTGGFVTRAAGFRQFSGFHLRQWRGPFSEETIWLWTHAFIATLRRVVQK